MHQLHTALLKLSACAKPSTSLAVSSNVNKRHGCMNIVAMGSEIFEQSLHILRT